MVERSHTGLRLDKYLNDNNSNQSSCCLIKLNRKPLSKGIKSPTVLDVDNTKAFCRRYKNAIGRSCRSIENSAAYTKQYLIPFPPYFPFYIRGYKQVVGTYMEGYIYKGHTYGGRRHIQGRRTSTEEGDIYRRGGNTYEQTYKRGYKRVKGTYRKRYTHKRTYTHRETYTYT